MTASRPDSGHRRRAAVSFAWRTVRGAIRALRDLHDEQVYAFEIWWQAGRALPEPRTGPLEWVRTLDGWQLAGNQLPDSGGQARTGEAKS